jgi:phage repressor protein C with HTH and peptisase S24 domain
MIRIIGVTGDSLTPEIKQGDFVVIATNPLFFRNFKPGDMLVFQHEQYGTMIKKFSHYEGENKKLYLTGNHHHSIDSTHFGAIDRKDLIGKVLWHIPNPQR